MSFFKSIFGKTPKATSPISIRETLFGDMAIQHWPPDSSKANEFPWDKFITARSELAVGNINAAIKLWLEIAARKDLEPRHRLQAWCFLRERGRQPQPDCAKELLGVVVEVGMPAGVDLLAAYSDYSARYYSYSDGGVVWEHPDASLNETIGCLFEAAKPVVAAIGPWEKPRPPAPPRDHARMSFLTPSGLHFGQGPMAALARDPLGGKVLHSATLLMQALIGKSRAT